MAGLAARPSGCWQLAAAGLCSPCPAAPRSPGSLAGAWRSCSCLATPGTRGLEVVPGFPSDAVVPEFPGRRSGRARLPPPRLNMFFTPRRVKCVEPKAAIRAAWDVDSTAFSWGLLEEGACSGHPLCAPIREGIQKWHKS